MDESIENITTSPDFNLPVQSQLKGNNDHIFEFIQEYVNEQAVNCINLIHSKERDATCKFDQVDWILRNLEFVTPK